MLGTNNNLSLSGTLPTAITTSPLSFNLQGGDLTRSVRRETTTSDPDLAGTIQIQSRWVDGKNTEAPNSKRQQINVRFVQPQYSSSSGVSDDLVVSLTISRLNALNTSNTVTENALAYLINMLCDSTARAALLRGET